jgi:hypothetical protein
MGTPIAAPDFDDRELMCYESLIDNETDADSQAAGVKRTRRSDSPVMWTYNPLAYDQTHDLLFDN